MALSASIYKVNIYISNLDTHFYQEFNLTIAQHPSENEARMMYRLLAFIHCAHDDLKFTQGLSNVDEPELWQLSLTGEIEHWVELGLPDEKRIKQAIGKSKRVSIFTYHKNKTQDWIPKIVKSFSENDKVKVYYFDLSEEDALLNMVQKSMKLTCTIQDNKMNLGDDNGAVEIGVSKYL